MSNSYIPYSAIIDDITVETEDASLKTFKLVIENEEERMAWRHNPGQFAMISVPGKGESPIGIASSPTEAGSVLFTIFKIGSVTTALHEMEKGERVGLRGPMGNGFPVDTAFKGKNIVIIGGGYAFTTLRATIAYLLANRQDYGHITVIYGSRSPGMLLYRSELEQWAKRGDISMNVTVDRQAPGWEGLVGFVPTITEKVAPSPENAVAMVCGPPIMIKFTMPPLEKIGWKDEQMYFSLENRMKCGLGVCGHCTCGPLYVCKDGPVLTRTQLKGLPVEF